MGNVTPKIVQYKIAPISCCVFCGGVHPLCWGKLPMNLREKEDVGCGYWCRAQCSHGTWETEHSEAEIVLGKEGLLPWFCEFSFLPSDPFVFFSKSKKISFVMQDIWMRKRNRCYFIYSFTDLCHSLFLVFQSSASTLDSNSAWLHSYQSLFSP